MDQYTNSRRALLSGSLFVIEGIWLRAKEEVMEDEVKQEREVNEEKTYTQAELDAETSKRVENALKKKEAKWAEEQEQKIADALKEYEERAKLSEKERIDKDLKKREEAIAERERQAELKEFTADVAQEVASQGLPAFMTELIVSSSNRDTADDLIGKIKTEWDNAIKEEVKGQARQRDARAPGSFTGQEIPSFSELAKKHRKI